MKAVFTCDDVFDILTREPFPSGGADDEIVESHLAVCHDCRQLAEAFRPAVGLFHESLSAGIDDELPSYRGRLQPIIETLAQEDVSSQSKSGHGWILYGMAIAASLILVGSVIFAALATKPSDGGSMPVASVVRTAQDRDYTLLAALEIPRNCRSMLESSERTLATEFVCCTKCHNATSRVVSTNLAILKSSAACAACHDQMLNNAASLVIPRSQVCESLLACAPIHSL
ncbi:MAG: hypothetical protein H8E66_15410 [Planctomycetes bacterium]|nr:hypothetical protein [Planctomycetota bacterium]